MKNIVIVVDGLANKYINGNENLDIIMPFINKLRNNFCSCENVYSQGPYTEAALTPLFSGADNLSEGGNFFRGKNFPTNIYKTFEEHGYRTMNFNQPMIYPTSQCIHLSDATNGVTYFFSCAWDYRLQYYADLKLNGDFNEVDKNVCVEILGDNFIYWVQWLTQLINKAPEVDFVQKYIEEGIDYQAILDSVLTEKEKFEKDKEAYLFDLFEKREEHILFKIPSVEMHGKCSNEIYPYIFEHKALINKIIKRAKLTAREPKLMLNLFNEFISESKDCGVKNALMNFVHKYYYYLEKRNKKAYFKELKEKQSNFKNEPSLGAYFNYFLDWEKDKDNYFANIHVSDIHCPCIFFTVEEEDKSVIDEELNIANELLDNLPKNYNGDIIYTLSMRYVDYMLEKFFKKLLDGKSISDYNIVITADHGNSFNFTPLRYKIVNNYYEENYQIPFVFVNGGKYQLDDNKFYTSKDIVKTLLDLNGFDTKEYNASNIVMNEGKEYAISEYLGGGCPDITRRDLCFVIRDKHYSIAYTLKIKDKFEDGELLAVFDRSKDINEKHNLRKTLNSSDYGYLLSILKDRFEEITKSLGDTWTIN